MTVLTSWFEERVTVVVVGMRSSDGVYRCAASEAHGQKGSGCLSFPARVKRRIHP